MRIRVYVCVYTHISCVCDGRLFLSGTVQCNHDNFVHMLSDLQFPFSLIGFSETKFKVDKDILANIELVNYDFISQPSLSNAGGVGFYIRTNLSHSILSYFTTTGEDFEALWIEIKVNGQLI